MLHDGRALATRKLVAMAIESRHGASRRRRRPSSRREDATAVSLW